MKKTINHRTYNTDTATLIEDYNNGRFTNDFKYISETLYITKKGYFFLVAEGGAMTKYAKKDGDGRSYVGGECIIPLDGDEAYDWLDDKDYIDIIHQYFKDC